MDLIQKVEIIFENEDFLVINKPAGLLVHPTNNSEGEKTLIDWISDKHPEIIGVGEPTDDGLMRPGIVHRLDRDTSGIMLVAKNNEAFFYLKNLFQEKKIKKTYLTLVFGNFSEKFGAIDKPIGIKSSSIKRSTAAKKIRDVKEALTEYKVIKNYSLDNGRKFALLEVYPKTGRTNQIRVHLASISHSVVGDKIYGSQKLHLPEGLNRMFLHAFQLELPLKNKSVLRLEADLPDDLKIVLEKLSV